MSFYEKHCLPHILNIACGMKPIRQKRQEVVPLASGGARYRRWVIAPYVTWANPRFLQIARLAPQRFRV